MISGNMQPYKFNLVKIIQYAARWHGNVEVVTNTVEGGIHRIIYSDLYERTNKPANALTKLGVLPRDRVGTMAWNTWRQLYGIGRYGVIC
ncbi:MAG: AMP-binding protein, partial [Robiginitomaculum sp.]|nr:AMP-binding protein [Robiginitomaculum sp.]